MWVDLTLSAIHTAWTNLASNKSLQGLTVADQYSPHLPPLIQGIYEFSKESPPVKVKVDIVHIPTFTSHICLEAQEEAFLPSKWLANTKAKENKDNINLYLISAPVALNTASVYTRSNLTYYSIMSFPLVLTFSNYETCNVTGSSAHVARRS